MCARTREMFLYLGCPVAPPYVMLIMMLYQALPRFLFKTLQSPRVLSKYPHDFSTLLIQNQYFSLTYPVSTLPKKSQTITMSSRTLHLFRSTRMQRLRSFPPTFRTFTASPFRSIKEDAARSPEELEKTKQEQLKAQKQGKAQWNEDLASAGEASITADREKVHDHDSHMEDLQKETAGQAEKEHPHGKKN
ncbi:hypothetical protein E4T50_02269 [Aureobasidium sp. EXF-12298]|nr:hypothetical protein E4T50_02269 [Aureobasidium sp. EXF-12298]KAI4764467.1 hypothetical protein E4T51_02501 [Aureobasidium sp. EXF-12344]KAI4782154.1 hypothetical protein E4T52_02943 [Aureobasidium sp. EXF-3400]